MSPMRRARPLSLTAACALSVGCTQMSSPEAVHLVVNPQTILTHRQTVPKVIVADHRGGFIVAGRAALEGQESYWTEWVARVDATGQKTWEHDHYKEPDRDGGQMADIGFNGVLVLADESILLCGAVSKHHIPNALLTRLAPDGQFVTETFLRPTGDVPPMGWTAFRTCLSWGDGFALVGNTLRGGWLVKLDRMGKLEWERQGDLYLGDQAIEMPNHDLILVGYPGSTKAQIVRLNTQGDVVASYTAPNRQAHIVYPLFKTEELRVYMYNSGRGALTWLTFDPHLRGIAESSSLGFGPGKAFELSDHSVIVFSAVHNEGASVIRRTADGSLNGSAMAPMEQSEGFIDAVPSGKSNEFVTIRTISSFYPGAPGWPTGSTLPPDQSFSNRPVVAWITVAAAK
jgi:hypothetical protein